MLGYTTIGTKDMDRAVAFYDALLAEPCAKQPFGMGDLDGNKLCFFDMKLD
jgi:catechol 2,3-dioxygenase-like lactoylglutathione lyase family enzyme